MGGRKALVIAAAVTVVLAGCSSGGSRGTFPATTAATSTTTTTSSTTTTTVVGPEATAVYDIGAAEVLQPGCANGSILRVTVTASTRALVYAPGSVTV